MLVLDTVWNTVVRSLFATGLGRTNPSFPQASMPIRWSRKFAVYFSSWVREHRLTLLVLGFRHQPKSLLSLRSRLWIACIDSSSYFEQLP